MKNRLRLYPSHARVACVLMAVSIFAVWAQVLEGRVVATADGDMITVLDGKRQQQDRTRRNQLDAGLAWW